MADLTQDLASLKIQREEDPNRPKPFRTAALALVVIGALGAGVWLGYPMLEARVFKMEVSLTEISLVSPAQASVTVTSTGYVVPQVISKVGARLVGRVSKIFIREGSAVKAGQVIAELEATDQRSSIAAAASKVVAAQARVDTAKANLAEIQVQVQRNRTLVERGAISKAALEDLESRAKSLEQSVRAADAEVRASQAEIGPMRVNLGDRTITTPIDGTVIAKPAQLGELVGPQNNVAIAEIADLSSQVVETSVPEARLYLIKAGSPCEIVLDAYPGKRYRGATQEIGSRVDRAKATVTVKVKFIDPMDGVLPDMSARTSFLSEEVSADAIKEKPKKVVPSSAVVERGGGKVVFVVNEGVTRMVPVKLGPAFGSGFELIDGPAPGTRVVVKPGAELSDGQRIKEKGSS